MSNVQEVGAIVNICELLSKAIVDLVLSRIPVVNNESVATVLSSLPLINVDSPEY